MFDFTGPQVRKDYWTNAIITMVLWIVATVVFFVVTDAGTSFTTLKVVVFVGFGLVLIIPLLASVIRRARVTALQEREALIAQGIEIRGLTPEERERVQAARAKLDAEAKQREAEYHARKAYEKQQQDAMEEAKRK